MVIPAARPDSAESRQRRPCRQGEKHQFLNPRETSNAAHKTGAYMPIIAGPYVRSVTARTRGSRQRGQPASQQRIWFALSAELADIARFMLDYAWQKGLLPFP